jgi:hypothetical protein
LQLTFGRFKLKNQKLKKNLAAVLHGVKCLTDWLRAEQTVKGKAQVLKTTNERRPYPFPS